MFAKEYEHTSLVTDLPLTDLHMTIIRVKHYGWASKLTMVEPKIVNER